MAETSKKQTKKEEKQRQRRRQSLTEKAQQITGRRHVGYINISDAGS